MRAGMVWGTVLPVAVVLLAGCTSDPEPVTPVTPSGAAPPRPTVARRPSPHDLGVDCPLSPLEDDPAVTALRGYLRGYAVAVNNGGDPQIPEVTDVRRPRSWSRACPR